MAFLSEIGVSIVSKLLEYTFKPVGRHLGYLFYYERNVSKLNGELKDLSLQRDKLTAEVDDAKRKGNEIHKKVEDWMNEAASFICEETRAELLNDEKCVKARCSGCNFPNFVLRYRISKQVDKIANRVLEMKAISFDQISYRPALDDSIRKEGLDFETRKPISDRIMKALEDPNVRTLGMYGIGGVGKTTLAKEIARQAKEEKKLFDKVITVTVSQTPDHEKIQLEIAGKLGLEFSNSESEKSIRANRLRQRLSQEKKILIILDDVWKKFDLFEVGIHFNDDQKGCKILMTSRRQVLFKSMDVKEIFCVETLTKDEATELFCSVVGDLRESPDCECLLNELVSECGGLPLVINTVAAALKGESLHKWKTALSEMRKSAPKNVDDMIQQVYPRLKMSYNFLHGEAQSLLLLCSIFPEDTLINDDDLLMYSVGWGIFNDIETVEDARDKMYTLIDTLRKNCLLLPSEKSRFDKKYYGVKVHDVIRDVAISIAKEKGWFNISSITQLEERPLEENLKVAIAISLLGDFSSHLPKSLLCPQLQSFVVHPRFQYDSSGLSTIPDCFFEENKKLRVLNLPYVSLQSPPSSFSCLSDSLQTLRLLGCNLEDTTFIGDLKKLRCLDLSFSKFQKLSKQIGQLTRLQLLALDHCWDLEVIEPTVISSLANLEELYMRQVKIKWEVESSNNKRCNVSLAELKDLQRLHTLYIRIEEADVMPKDLFTNKLKRYEIIVGQQRYYGAESSKVLDLELNESSLLYSSGLEKLIEESEDLRLSGLIDMEEIVVCKRDDGIKFPELRSLSLEKLPKLVQFSRSLEWETASCSSAPPNSSLPLFNDKITFPVLEKLKLSHLHYVQTLWSDNLPKVPSMQNLKTLRVDSCNRLKYLFSFAMARSFVHLEELVVCCCEMMEEVLVIKEATGEEERPKETTILFRQLETLELNDLPNLKRLYRRDLIIEFPTLRELNIRNCTESAEETAEPLLSEKDAFSNSLMKFLQLSETSLKNLVKLEIINCNNKEYLFPLHSVESLAQLKNLSLWRCERIEEVVVEVTKEEREEGSFKKISFPKLESLILEYLPRLKRFCAADCIECPSLLELRIDNCPEYRPFTPTLTAVEEEIGKRDLVAQLPMFNEKDAFSNSLMKFLQLSETSFKNLVNLEIFNCNNIEYLFPLHSVESLAQLKNLSLRGCERIEEVVVEVTKEEREEGSFKKISFPKLESLELVSLPRLKRFCAADCIECPSLLELCIVYCPEYRTFTPTLTGIEEEIGRRDLVAQLPMFNEKITFPVLEELKLSGLHSVQTLWSDNLPKVSSMQNLKTLRVDSCNRLKYLFSFAMARSFVHLEELVVYGCEMMEEVLVIKEATGEEEMPKETTILFPQLESLELYDLPNLKRLYRGDLIIEFPTLRELNIRMSTKSAEETAEPLLSEKVEFPNLEELMILDFKGTEILNEIWPSQSSAVPFPKLKQLRLRCSQDRNWAVLPFDIHKYQNLELIILSGFSCMGNLEQHKEILEVESCSRLKALLMSSSVTFKNLGQLRISQYHGMINVLASSTVKCLVQLKTMSISECDQMTEIIVDDKEGEAQNTEIAFTPLKTLVLHCLPTLKCFYSGKSNIQFPNLEKVIVSECPQMENFSRGTVITSKLDTVITKFNYEFGWMWPEYSEHIKEVWKGDLNTSVRTVWEDLHSSTKVIL